MKIYKFSKKPPYIIKSKGGDNIPNFNKKYVTFNDWSKSHSVQTGYVKRISRLHKQHPKLTLTELNRLKTGSTSKKPNLSKLNFDKMTATEKRHYKAGLDIIAKARQQSEKVTFDDMLKKLKSENSAFKGLNKAKIRQFLESAIDENGYIKDTDNIEREMKILNKKGQCDIVVRGNNKATLISQYHHALKKYRDTGDYSALLEFKGKNVTDINGKKRNFITSEKLLNKLIENGETDFYDIYK